MNGQQALEWALNHVDARSMHSGSYFEAMQVLRDLRSAQKPSLDVDALAQEIRRVDGNHRMGAGALAEALVKFLSHPPEQRAK